jgi:DNA-binding winged helix-turn-helix (wHTH) protein/tetratricopeptide (TPR) repeat protein
MIYAFGEFELDESRGELRRADARVPLEPKPYAVLRHLIRHRRRVVSKGELLERVWPEVAVADDALSGAIRRVRRALGDTGAEERFVHTLRGRGFRFVAPVQEIFTEAMPASAEPRRERSDFVGRAEVLAGLGEALEEVSRGRGRIVLLTGEPGIGKTRTAEELARGACMARDPPLVLTGWCASQSGAEPYWPWLRILRGLVDAVDDEAIQGALCVSARALVRLVPELGVPSPGLVPASEGSPEGSRFRLYEAVAAFLRAAAAERTLLLLLDDLQWADSSSLRLLEFLARDMAQARVLLVATLREGEIVDGHPVCDTLEAFSRIGRFERIELRGLAPGEIASLVEHLCGSRVSEERIAAIASRSDGNPFFVRELALEALESRGEEEVVPPLLGSVLSARLHRLPSPAREVLEAAAVSGARLEAAVVAHALGRSREEVAEALDGAVRSGLVVPDPQHLGWRFAHALVHEAVSAGVAGDRARELHHRIALAIESHHRSDLDSHAGALALHLAAALPLSDRETAVAWARRAGDVAFERLAFDEAVVHHESAVQLYDREEAREPGSAGQLAYALARSLHCAGRGRPAFDAFARAAELAGTAGDAALMVDATCDALKVSYEASLPDTWAECRSLLERALAMLPEDDSHSRAMVMARLAELPFLPLGRRDRLAAQALAMAERLGDLEAIAEALLTCWVLGHRPGHADERLALTTRQVRVSEAAGVADWMFQAHYRRYYELLVQGRASESEAELRLVEEWAERTGEPAKRALPSLYWAGRALWGGRFEEAETRIAGALSELPPGVVSWAHVWARQQALCLRLFQGRLGEVPLPPLESILSEASSDERYFGKNWSCGMMYVLHRLGNRDAARRVLEAVVPDAVELPVGVGRVCSLALLSEVAADQRDRERCERLLAELEPEAGLQVPVDLHLIFGCASRFLGMLARALARFDEAERHFEVALAADARMGARPWMAETQLEYAALLLDGGSREDRRRAEALLDRACATASELGMAAVTRRAEELRR